MIHEDTIEFSWDTYEYEHREKSADWYWALGILVVVGATIAFITKNFLFGFLLLLGGFMMGLFASKKNDPISVEISVRGVSLNGKTMNFADIKAFWMYRNPFGIRKLVMKTNRNFAPMVSLPIPDDMRATDLREFLLTKVPEQELKESFVDLLLERIGF
jgi:hypothetical protein